MARKRKVETVVEKPVETGLDVIYSGHTNVTREAKEAEYDKDDTSTTWIVESVCLKDEYPELTACFPVKTNDVVYIVYAVYSTGDSFGREDDGRIVFIDAFATAEKADVAARVIREHADWDRDLSRRWSPMTKAQRKALEKKYPSPHSVDIIRENSETMSVHASWTGYFESLSYVEVAGFVVDAGKRQRY